MAMADMTGASDSSTSMLAASGFLVGAKTGDDDDIDDLIVERARKRATDRARSESSGGGARETEDDLYVGNKPKPDAKAARDIAPSAKPASMKRISCGTHWTDWADKKNPQTNPCPANCEPGEMLLEKSHPQGETVVVARQYQCNRVLSAQTISSGPRMPVKAVGTLTPDSGGWGDSVRVSGEKFASVESVRVYWYPNDDDTQPAVMQQTATIHRRHGANAIDIQLPSDPAKSGWSGEIKGGVVRVYLFLPKNVEPLLAGRYSVQPQQLGNVAREKTLAEGSIAVTTSPLQMTGKRLLRLSAGANRELTSPPTALTTLPLRMTGKRLATLGTSPREELELPPLSLTTPALQMAGQRLRSRPVLPKALSGRIGLTPQPPR